MAHSANYIPGSTAPLTRDADAGAYHAYQTLHFGYVLLPLIAGIDKFTEYLADWDKYLAPVVSKSLGVAAHSCMMAVGVIEIVASLLVAFFPRIGAYVVAGWLAGIILNLALNPIHYWDVAARDFGLLLGALALGSLTAWVGRRREMAP
jgi:hypothetical protein